MSANLLSAVCSKETNSVLNLSSSDFHCALAPDKAKIFYTDFLEKLRQEWPVRFTFLTSYSRLTRINQSLSHRLAK